MHLHHVNQVFQHHSTCTAVCPNNIVKSFDLIQQTPRFRVGQDYSPSHEIHFAVSSSLDGQHLGFGRVLQITRWVEFGFMTLVWLNQDFACTVMHHT
ncbi:hypothetical protein HZ326_6776 [Fusarium oxysporum f. sp. albedinis]|nr:hypothetical protein HZ326_6776 [Fusarium oxysporum f. sp. albedinis]